mmetsp:Transcript_85208/g.258598  ORF Transcript_85208/g.258598 Transcript_85208/m.258598 type:complete len:451 (+) Transcript_85208:118-1470(+)
MVSPTSPSQARRAAIEEHLLRLRAESQGLQREGEELEAEAVLASQKEEQVAEQLEAALESCRQLEEQLAGERELACGEACKLMAEAQARRLAYGAVGEYERDALREQVALLQERSTELEARTAHLRWQTAEARERAAQGEAEIRQLRAERYDRQGERAMLVVDQENVARQSAEQRSQVPAFNEQMTQLMAEFGREGAQLAQQQRHIQALDARLGATVEAERQQIAEALSALPSLLEEARAEARRCEAVAQGLQRGLGADRDALAQLGAKQEAMAADAARSRSQLQQAEGRCQTARDARLAVEQVLFGTNAEVRRLEEEVEAAEEQIREAILEQLPLRDSCALGVQWSLRQMVEEHLRGQPAEEEPNSAEAEEALRQALAGLGPAAPSALSPSRARAPGTRRLATGRPPGLARGRAHSPGGAEGCWPDAPSGGGGRSQPPWQPQSGYIAQG